MAKDPAARELAQAMRKRAKHADLVMPFCCECGQRIARLVGGEAVYPHRRDLFDRLFWLCPCGAYCGCHKGTDRPLGRPALNTTHNARIAAHAALDPLWKAKMVRDGVDQKTARGAAYRWLAGQLGISTKECHIGYMDRVTAIRVCEVIRAARSRSKPLDAAAE